MSTVTPPAETKAAPTSYAVFRAKSDDVCLSVYTLAEAVEWIKADAPPDIYDILGFVPDASGGTYRRVKSIAKKGG